MYALNKKLNTRSGYIAVVSATIISVLLLSIVAALSLSTYFTRFNIFDSFSKERGRALAESCADIALLRFRESASYVGNETIPIDDDAECNIETLVTNNNETTLYTSAHVDDARTRMKIVVSGVPATLMSWEEVDIE